jgi:hypothetical protein
MSLFVVVVRSSSLSTRHNLFLNINHAEQHLINNYNNIFFTIVKTRSLNLSLSHTLSLSQEGLIWNLKSVWFALSQYSDLGRAYSELGKIIFKTHFGKTVIEIENCVYKPDKPTKLCIVIMFWNLTVVHSLWRDHNLMVNLLFQNVRAI